MQIGKLAALSGHSTATIRYYERIGVISPAPRTPSGYRNYDGRALEELGFVRAGRAIGISLTELSEIVAFRDRGEAPCAELLALMKRRLSDIEDRLAELHAIRSGLAGLVAAAEASDLDDCPPAALYRLVGS